MVKRMVNPHSMNHRMAPYRSRKDVTLSRHTAITLSTIAMSRAISKALPAAVSASKMISCSARCQGFNELVCSAKGGLSSQRDDAAQTTLPLHRPQTAYDSSL